MATYVLIFINIGQKMITNKLNTEFWVITDTHLIANQLHDNGPAFKQIQSTSQGKDLVYQEIALRAFCKFANEKKPAAIIVTGDVTFNGELLSAQRFQKIFSSLTDTKLFLLPGNHDIFDGWARSFSNDQQLYTKQISPTDWRNIFHESYDHAWATDSSSLAYSIQLNPQYLLLMLDTNIYGQKEALRSPVTAGFIGEMQLAWLEKQLKFAQKHNLYPLLFMHHNLYVHNPAVNRGFVIDNASSLSRLCQKYDVKLAFSGHIHAQNIVKPQPNIPTTEIVTSSFCSFDQAYGLVKVKKNQIRYQRQTFNMRPYLSAEEQKSYTLTHFHNYLKDIQLKNLTHNMTQKDKNSGQKINKFFIESNYNYFTGHNHINEKKLIQLYNSEEYRLLTKYQPKLGRYLQTLFDTTDHSNLNIQINFKEKQNE